MKQNTPVVTKSLEGFFRDWESNAFGFGYGSGELHVLGSLKRFLDLCPIGNSYDFQVMEAALTPPVTWLMINALARHTVDAIEYGTSPRYGWLTEHGSALAAFVAGQSVDDLVEIVCSREEGDALCYPDFCNCDRDQSRLLVRCQNPFWDSKFITHKKPA